ncbi:MAG: hypothetical protein ABEJ69_00835 [Candidatus Nanohaloarchaea archaeon]
MRTFRAVVYLLVIALFFTAPAAAQFDGGNNILDNTLVEWADNISAMNIDTMGDFVIFIVLPFIGMYGLFWFLIRKALLLTENNFGENTGIGSSGELSDTGKKASSLMAAAMATLFIFAYGGLTVPFALLIGLLGGLFLLWQLLGVARAGTWGGNGGGGGGGGGGGNGPQNIDVDVDTSDIENQMNQMNQNINNLQQSIENIDIDMPEGWPPGPGPGPGPGRAAIPPIVQMMQQQQQQQQMSPAVMQFMMFMMGNFYRQGSTIRIPGEGGAQPVEAPVEVANEFGDVVNNLEQNMVSQTMVQAMTELLNQNQQLNQQMMEQVFEFIHEYEQNPRMAIENVEKFVQGNNYEQTVEGDINQAGRDINTGTQQVMNQVQQQQVLQNVVNEIQQEGRFQQINPSLMNQILAILDGDVRFEGDAAVIVVPRGQDVKVDPEILKELYNELMRLQNNHMKLFLNRLHQLLLNIEHIRETQRINQEILIMIGEMVEEILEGGGEPETGPEGPNGEEDKKGKGQNGGMADDPIEQEIQKIISDIEDEMTVEKEEMKIDEDALKRLEDALKRYNQHESDLEQIMSFSSGGIEGKSGMELLQQAQHMNLNLSLPELAETLKQIHTDLSNALNELREKDKAMKKSQQEERDAEKHLQHVEEEYMSKLGSAVETIENLEHSNLQH